MAVNQPKKKQSLRNNEYYNTQELFDDLYEKSQHSEVFTHLIQRESAPISSTRFAISIQ